MQERPDSGVFQETTEHARVGVRTFVDDDPFVASVAHNMQRCMTLACLARGRSLFFTFRQPNNRTVPNFSNFSRRVDVLGRAGPSADFPINEIAHLVGLAGDSNTWWDRFNRWEELLDLLV